MNKPPVIIWVVATSFGEVDWLLPVMYLFKKRFPEWQIITLFGHQLVYQGLVSNKPLFEEFYKISSLNIVPQEIDTLFSQNISAEQVKIIFKDFNKDEFAPFKSSLAEKCPEALVVSYPHSNYIYANCTSEAVVDVDNPDAYSKHDIFLLSSEHDIPFWSHRVAVEKIRTFGYPVFDRWWSKKLLQSTYFLESPENRLANKGDKVFFHVSRHPHPVYLAEADYLNLLEQLLEQVFAYDDSVLLIKRHPRQDLSSFQKILESYDSSRWMFSDLHLSQLSSLSDLVISFWSSGILNALSVGVPVIEFYRFGRKNSDWRRLPDGSATSIYRELGLAVPANNGAELSQQINAALQGQGNVWKLQHRAFATHCHINDNASAAIIDSLLLEMEQKKVVELKKENLNEEKVIDQQIALCEQLVADGIMDRAQHCLEKLKRKFPDDPRAYCNLGVLLFNIGDTVAAIKNLVKALNCDPLHIDSAISLCQVMAALERLDDAKNIVISFMENTSNEDLQRSFRSGLEKQLTNDQFDQLHPLLAMGQNC